MKNRSKEYVSYIYSLEWHIQRVAAIERAGNKCQRCGAPGETHVLQVHHLNYERLGREFPEDLKVVCVECHKIEDVEREAETERRHHDRRLEGWASKVYGEDWQDRVDSDEVQERFDSWLERKQNDY